MTPLPNTLFLCSQAFFSRIKNYSSDDKNLLTEALYASAEYHGSQRRKSGQLFIIHPLQVFLILSWIKADLGTLIAGLLHDVLEDTNTTPEEIKNRFGDEVYKLVEAVTHNAIFSNKEFLEKVYSKSTENYRVACIKIADRCANIMQGSQLVFPVEKHTYNLLETQEFYVKQLSTIPSVPPQLIKLLIDYLKDSERDLTNRH